MDPSICILSLHPRVITEALSICLCREGEVTHRGRNKGKQNQSIQRSRIGRKHQAQIQANHDHQRANHEQRPRHTRVIVENPPGRERRKERYKRHWDVEQLRLGRGRGEVKVGNQGGEPELDAARGRDEGDLEQGEAVCRYLALFLPFSLITECKNQKQDSHKRGDLSCAKMAALSKVTSLDRAEDGGRRAAMNRPSSSVNTGKRASALSGQSGQKRKVTPPKAMPSRPVRRKMYCHPLRGPPA